MKKNPKINETLQKYASLTELDVHYYGLKSYGIDYEDPEKGRPKLHILDNSYLYSVVPLLTDIGSPYVLRDQNLTFEGKDLPFRVKYFKRSNDPYYSYFYFRSKEKWMQTLDAETSLNLNFNPNCSGCSFCTRVNKSGLQNLTAQEGMDRLTEGGTILSDINELAVVTGMFRDEAEVVNHITDILDIAHDKGFYGKLLYIGSQIKSPKSIKRILGHLDENLFKYVYTLESFTNRVFNHKKQETLDEGIQNLEILRDSGVKKLEYTYIPGIDLLADFFKTAPKITSIARPHTSIFRPAIESQRELPCSQFKENPVDYLCKMRLFFEDLYGEPIYGNNLANLWPFPLERLDERFSSNRTNAN